MNALLKVFLGLEDIFSKDGIKMPDSSINSKKGNRQTVTYDILSHTTLEIKYSKKTVNPEFFELAFSNGTPQKTCMNVLLSGDYPGHH